MSPPSPDAAPNPTPLEGALLGDDIASSRAGSRTNHDAARSIADRLGVELGEVPGAHVPYLRDPETLAEAIRAFLR